METEFKELLEFTKGIGAQVVSYSLGTFAFPIAEVSFPEDDWAIATYQNGSWQLSGLFNVLTDLLHAGFAKK